MRATRSWSRGCLASLLLLMMLKCASVQAQTQTQYWTLVKYMSDKSCTFTERNPPLRLLKNGQCYNNPYNENPALQSSYMFGGNKLELFSGYDCRSAQKFSAIDIYNGICVSDLYFLVVDVQVEPNSYNITSDFVISSTCSKSGELHFDMRDYDTCLREATSSSTYHYLVSDNQSRVVAKSFTDFTKGCSGNYTMTFLELEKCFLLWNFLPIVLSEKSGALDTYMSAMSVTDKTAFPFTDATYPAPAPRPVPTPPGKGKEWIMLKSYLGDKCTGSPKTDSNTLVEVGQCYPSGSGGSLALVKDPQLRFLEWNDVHCNGSLKLVLNIEADQELPCSPILGDRLAVEPVGAGELDPETFGTVVVAFQNDTKCEPSTSNSSLQYDFLPLDTCLEDVSNGTSIILSQYSSDTVRRDDYNNTNCTGLPIRVLRYDYGTCVAEGTMGFIPLNPKTAGADLVRMFGGSPEDYPLKQPPPPPPPPPPSPPPPPAPPSTGESQAVSMHQASHVLLCTLVFSLTWAFQHFP